LAISLLGAGFDAHVVALSVIAQTAAGGARPLSLAGIASTLGVPAQIANILPLAALVAGTGAIWLLRRRPDRSFVVAVATLVFGSPTVNINWFILLFATLAPLAWPWRREGHAVDGAITGAMDVEANGLEEGDPAAGGPAGTLNPASG
jgi:hypothetical protein